MLIEALTKAIETAFAASADEIAVVAHEVAAATSVSIGCFGGCFRELLRSPASYGYDRSRVLDNAEAASRPLGEGLAERVE